MEEYLRILKNMENKRMDNTFLYITSCLNYKNLDVETLDEQANMIYNFWLDSDVELDLSKLCDVVSFNFDKIKQEKTAGNSYNDILDLYYNR